ncbi:hypothetical protein CDAR_546641 [Caerostris darwini]|uniref:Uncharacterized protein n=1 Tax=Caerostris darwini TaxID=1538125 RepID=A0AAV4PFM2_9ARAC|nr:hypothetical protein CDAR_546641 [Caerostris darwini]
MSRRLLVTKISAHLQIFRQKRDASHTLWKSDLLNHVHAGKRLDQPTFTTYEEAAKQGVGDSIWGIILGWRKVGWMRVLQRISSYSMKEKE